MSDNIRCTTMKDGTMYHTLMANGKMHVLGVVRSIEDVNRQRRVNILRSRSIK